MKKTVFLSIILLVVGFSLSASPNWVGAQVVKRGGETTLTTTFLGVSSSNTTHSESSGLLISGSFYPSQESSIGLGYQLGATSLVKTQTGGITTQADSDAPLTWKAGLSAQYRADISGFLTLEFGAGIHYEYVTDSATSEGITTTYKSGTINLAATSNLLLHISDSFALVGGLDFLFPIITNIEMSIGGMTANPDVEIEGNGGQFKVGVAFSL